MRMKKRTRFQVTPPSDFDFDFLFRFSFRVRADLSAEFGITAQKKKCGRVRLRGIGRRARPDDCGEPRAAASKSRMDDIRIRRTVSAPKIFILDKKLRWRRVVRSHVRGPARARSTSMRFGRASSNLTQ